MAIFISVISHGHSNLINELGCLERISKKCNVVIKSNKQGDSFSELLDVDNIHWIDSDYGYGFGYNNNIVFEYCLSKLGMTYEDFFIVLNPDVYIELEEIERLIENMICDEVKISAINLFRDSDKTVYDNSIRRFPNGIDFLSSFLGFGNKTIINKDEIKSRELVDWGAGSFLAFRSNHYKFLGGFDHGYFMYCEDIDICYRSAIIGEKVMYYYDIQAVHFAQHANRKLLSKHFLWHVISTFRFLFSKYGFTRVKSILL